MLGFITTCSGPTLLQRHNTFRRELCLIIIPRAVKSIIRSMKDSVKFQDVWKYFYIVTLHSEQEYPIKNRHTNLILSPCNSDRMEDIHQSWSNCSKTVVNEI
jgi:hypothetical protein